MIRKSNISKTNTHSTVVQRSLNARSKVVKLASIEDKMGTYQSLLDTADSNYREALNHLNNALESISNVSAIMGEVDSAVEEIDATLQTVRDLGIDLDVPLDDYANDLEVLKGIDPGDSAQLVKDAITKINEWL